LTPEAAEDARNKLQELGPSVAVTFMINPENYFEVITSLVDSFCRENDLGCIYVTASVPAATMINALDSLEIDRKHVKFIDCISYATMQLSGETDAITYVEGPAMLENIILRVEYLFRKGDKKKMLVIIDSMNAMAMHNDTRMLSEFIQIMMSALKGRDAYPVLLALGDQLRPEVKEMLGLVSDQVVPLGVRPTV
jgi:archaellum biogenesis ATPase FlaH